MNQSRQIAKSPPFPFAKKSQMKACFLIQENETSYGCHVLPNPPENHLTLLKTPLL